MTIEQICTIYQKLFHKGLNVKLEIDEFSDVTEEFRRLFETKYNGKEIYFPQLKGTPLDTDRWGFSADLCIEMMSIPRYLPNARVFEVHRIVFAELLPVLIKVPIGNVFKLREYIKEDDREDFEEYIQLVLVDLKGP